MDELRTLTDIWPVFERYGLGWMAQPSGRYSSELVREFYASYAASVDLGTPVGQKFILQPILTHVMVHGTHMDISEQTIHRFLFGFDVHFRLQLLSLIIGWTLSKIELGCEMRIKNWSC